MEGVGRKIALVLSILGTLLLVIGVSTPYWICASVNNERQVWIGLFKECVKRHGDKSCTSVDDRPDLWDWFKAVRALEMIAVICAGGSAIMQIVYVVKQRMPINRHLIKIILLSGVAAAFCGLVGVIVFGAKKKQDLPPPIWKLDWSFGLTTAGGALFVVTGVLLVMEIRSGGPAGSYAQM